MNYSTFRQKERLLYVIPTMLVDLLIHILVFEYLLRAFHFTDPQDLILARPRSLYFLVVGYLISVLAIPIKFFERGAGIRDLFVRAFLQTLATLLIFAVSVQVLFASFAGRFFLREGIIATILISAWHLFFRFLIIAFRRRGRNKVHVALVGSSSNSISLYNTLLDDRYLNAYKVLGFFTDDPGSLPGQAVCLGSVADAGPYLSSNKVHELYCGLNPATDSLRVNELIRICENNFINFFYVPDMEGYLHRTMSFAEIGSTVIVKLREEPLDNPANALIKRTFDVVVSGLLLITVYPLVWLFVAIGTKISSPGPILFRQSRTGYRGKPFKMLKFRSMRVNSQADTLQATEDDPRKTAFGDFLRKTSIDELPQLINVFKGDMSLIGPRPHMEHHTEVYSKLVDEYLVRHMVKPGLTGWAQVNGCRGETREISQMADRVRHDIWYIEHWSVWLDIKIIFMTLGQILGGDKQAY